MDAWLSGSALISIKRSYSTSSPVSCRMGDHVVSANLFLISLFTPASRVIGGVRDFARVFPAICASVSGCPRSKRKTARATNPKVGTDVVRGSR